MEPLYLPWILNRKRPYSNDLTPILPIKKAKSKPQFRLISVCSRDAAETSRLILNYAGVQFEDLTVHNYRSVVQKHYDLHSMGFPILDWNGKFVIGKCATARMLAKIYGLAGHGLFEEAQVDAIFGIIRDLHSHILGYIQGILGFKKINKEEMYAELFEPAVKKSFAIIEKYASDVGPNGFFFSSGVTFADFAVANMFELLSFIHPKLMSQFVFSKAIMQRVFLLPQLQQYLAGRPTPMLLCSQDVIEEIQRVHEHIKGMSSE